MEKIQLPHFGEFVYAADKDYWVNVPFQERIISIDINISDAQFLPQIQEVQALLARLEEQDIINQAYIQEDLSNSEGSEAKFYSDFHLENLDQQLFDEIIADLDSLNNEIRNVLIYSIDYPIEAIEQVIDELDGAADFVSQLLKKAKLKRVGFYLSEEPRIVFDYSFGVELTNYILGVFTNLKGDLLKILVES